MMRWFKRWKRKPGGDPGLRTEQVELVREIQKAHMEWQIAQKRLDYVVEKEQIDYVVYAMEAAEKRFEMLLKQAKQSKVTRAEVCASREVEGG
ncbi:YaaL family protein [Paenibacillus sp. P26]|nr:YaaL family protein [Paenibacillus sp. P26]UUZ91648.1 YaaL family protein [Paenibacillus sp. P25]